MERFQRRRVWRGGQNSRIPSGILRRNSRFGNSSFRNSRFRNSNLKNFRIPCYVIPQLDWGISSQRILKFRHCEGAKQREQSLGILEFLVEFSWEFKFMEFQFREFQNSLGFFWGLGGIFQEFQFREFQNSLLCHPPA